MTGLVGRERELAGIEACLEDCRALALTGEAGIGKTAVWRAGVRRAHEQGWQVLTARPGEQETRLAGAVLTDLFGCELPGRAVLGRLRKLAAAGPTLVAIDDLQWVDEVSEAALQFAARRLEDDRVAMLLTLREARARPLGLERLEQLVLLPLGEEGLDALVREHGCPLPRATLRRVHRLSGGNPFFALELARAVEGSTVRVPTTLRGLVGRRLDDLRTDVLVAVAAARQPTPASVQAVVGAGADAAIAAAVERRVLEVDAGRLRFAHPLLQSVAYEDASPELRRSVHERLATTATDPEERLTHRASATALPDERIADALEHAGAAAAAEQRSAAAAWLLEEAVRLTQRESRDVRFRRALAGADLCRELGDGGRARALLDGVLDDLPATPDRARALRRLAAVQAADLGFAAAPPVLGEALACASGDAALTAAIERDLATAIAQFGNLDEAAGHARRALDFAAAGDAAHEREVQTQLDAIDLLRGHRDPRALEWRLATRTPQSAEMGFLAERMMLASMLKWIDRLEPARATLEDMCEAVRDRDADGLLAPLAFQLAELECWAGDLDTAERGARESRDAALRAGQRSSEALGRYVGALVAAWRGEGELARREAEAGLALAEQEGDVRHVVRNLKVLGFTELSLGRPATASALLARAHAAALGSACREPGFYRLEGDLLEAYVEAGDRDAAEQVLADLRAAARRPWARAIVARGEALLLGGDAEEATRLAAALGQPLEHARSLLVEGALHRRVKRKRLAAEALDRAQAMFAARGARLWAARAAAERSRIGGRAPAPAGLTQTELQVAELVAAGRANKEVAAQLHLSVKTVEANLSRIYRKLGIRSRSELAARRDP